MAVVGSDENALSPKERKREYARNRRASISMEKYGFVKKKGGQSYVTEEEECHLHETLVDDIKHSVHHPPMWLCEQVWSVLRLSSFVSFYSGGGNKS
jgi:hypothetical protein